MKKSIRILACILAAAMLLVGMGACANEPAANTTAATDAPVGNTTAATENQGISVTDMAGNTITLDQAPTAVFCQSSMFEQLIMVLGAESVLRASSYSRADDPRNIWFQTLYPQIMDIEAADGDKNGITNELLVAYELDLMLVGNQDAYDEFTALGIPCVVLDIQSLDDLLEGIQIVGKCLGGAYTEKAEAVVSYCAQLLSNVEEKIGTLAAEEKLTAYFMESRYAASEPTLYMTWGADSFQANCLKLAGINTVADSLFEGGVRAEITTEQLLVSDPDVIVIGGFYEQTNYDALVVDETLKTLSAVQNGKIYRAPVGASEWTRIGVESILLPVWYGAVLYPTLFADTDIDAVVTEFYEKVMGVELSDAYRQAILSGAEAPAK